MSLLAQISRRAAARPIASISSIRLSTTKATPGSGLTTTRQDHEKDGLVEPTEAPKHVVTADVVSGAPSKPYQTYYDIISLYDVQSSCDTALSVSTSPLVILCRYAIFPIHDYLDMLTTVLQSGGAKSDQWRVDWDILQGSGRWENPLMGWASS
jgi:hypothetical protein